MNELTISRHNFQKELEKLRDFQMPSLPDIKKVEENGKFLKVSNHNVTGQELNGCLGDISKSFVSTNMAITSIRKEFIDVYNTFDILDKQYIEGIIASLQSSNVALEKVSKTQESVQNTVEALKITVEVLKNFKEQISKNIDGIEVKAHELEQSINSVESALTEQIRDLGDKQAKHEEELAFSVANLSQSVDDRLSSERAANNNRLDGIEVKAHELEQSINSVESALAEQIQELGDKQAKHEEELASRVASLSQSVGDRLASERAANNNRLDGIDVKAHDLERTINSVESALTEQIQELGDKQAKHEEELASRVANLSQSVDDRLSSERAANNNRLDGIEVKAHELEQSINSVESALTEQIQEQSSELSKDKQAFEEYTTYMNKRMKHFAYAIGISLIMNILLLVFYFVHIL